MNLEETLDMAAQSANLFVSDVRKAHSAAINANPFAEVLMLDLLTQAVKMEQTLKHLAAVAAQPTEQ